MNVPNWLTLSRMVMSLVFIWVLAVAVPGNGMLLVAGVLFALASVTDFLDGYLARKWNQVTNFGKLFDPLADKVLVCSGFILLAGHDLLPAWLAALIVAREFLVTGLRGVAADAGQVLPADQWGKWKTVVHMATILLVLFGTGTAEVETAFVGEQQRLFEWVVPFAGAGLVGDLFWLLLYLACLVLAWISGVRYMWVMRKVLDVK